LRRWCIATNPYGDGRQGPRERPVPIARRVDPGLGGDLSQRRDTPKSWESGPTQTRPLWPGSRCADLGAALGAASGAVLGAGIDGVGAFAGAVIGAALCAPAEVITSIGRAPRTEATLVPHP
jgi:hypothetical protein